MITNNVNNINCSNNVNNINCNNVNNNYIKKSFFIFKEISNLLNKRKIKK